MIGLAALLLGFAAGPAPAGGRVAVGAIYWPGWTGHTEWANNLKPAGWHYRLPFYADASDGRFSVRSDNQVTMDREIEYASEAGLSYFAFDYSPHAARAGLPLYLSSRHKDQLDFCVILLGSGAKSSWPDTVRSLIALFRQPTYQKVAGGRPLVYRYYVEKMAAEFGSIQAARRALGELRSAAVAAGLKPPYLVAQVWSAAVGARAVDELGFDAISAYSMSFDAQTSQAREYPYSRLAAINRAFWDACRKAGKETIPIVNTGWDVRPRWWDKPLMRLYGGEERPWFAPPTPAELTDNMASAIRWDRAHPGSARANSVLIYSWNESDEGGWLVPTLAEGTARIEAIRRALEEAHDLPAR